MAPHAATERFTLAFEEGLNMFFSRMLFSDAMLCYGKSVVPSIIFNRNIANISMRPKQITPNFCIIRFVASGSVSPFRSAENRSARYLGGMGELLARLYLCVHVCVSLLACFDRGQTMLRRAILALYVAVAVAAAAAALLRSICMYVCTFVHVSVCVCMCSCMLLLASGGTNSFTNTHCSAEIALRFLGRTHRGFWLERSGVYILCCAGKGSRIFLVQRNDVRTVLVGGPMAKQDECGNELF